MEELLREHPKGRDAYGEGGDLTGAVTATWIWSNRNTCHGLEWRSDSYTHKRPIGKKRVQLKEASRLQALICCLNCLVVIHTHTHAHSDECCFHPHALTGRKALEEVLHHAAVVRLIQHVQHKAVAHLQKHSCNYKQLRAASSFVWHASISGSIQVGYL